MFNTPGGSWGESCGMTFVSTRNLQNLKVLKVVMMIGRLLFSRNLVLLQGYIELCGGVRQIDENFWPRRRDGGRSPPLHTKTAGRVSDFAPLSSL